MRRAGLRIDYFRALDLAYRRGDADYWERTSRRLMARFHRELRRERAKRLASLAAVNAPLVS